MSYVDELAERTPPRRTPRQRRPRPDQRSLRTRRAIAVGIGILLLIGLILLIKGCRDSARVQSFKDYVRNVGQMADQSNQESQALFKLLTNPGGHTPVELQTAVNGFRTDATGLVLRAQGTDRPDELASTQTYLIETLEFRRDAIGSIADQLPNGLASGTAQTQAAGRIAGAMQELLASDVVFSQRVVPTMTAALSKQGLLSSVQIPHSRFLGDTSWIDPSTASQRLSSLSGGGQSGTVRRLSIGTVVARPGGETLSSSGGVQLGASPNLSFDVTITNEGAFSQHDVVVKVSVSGGSTPISVEQHVASVDPGAQQTVNIPLASTLPTGASTVTIQIEPATGIQDSGTTKASFPVTFAGSTSGGSG